MNSNKPILMIHEVTEELFRMPLENYILTFDDGRLSQYDYFDRISEIKTDKIFFVVPCRIEHLDGSYPGKYGWEHCMNLDQIKKIASQYRCFLGGHSYYHAMRGTKPEQKYLPKSHAIDKLQTKEERIDFLQKDTSLMMKWFKNTFNLRPQYFCYPWNAYNRKYEKILFDHGFERKYIYGAGPQKNRLLPKGHRCKRIPK
jgi:hypothetical protein